MIRLLDSNKILVGLIAVATLAIGSILGILYQESITTKDKPVVQTVIQYVPQVKEIIKEVPIVQIKEIPITQIKEVPVIQVKEVPITQNIIIHHDKLKNFDTVEELTNWVNNNKTCLLHADIEGVINLINIPQLNNCTEYATRLQTLAYYDGYFMSLALVKDGEYYFTTVLNRELFHAHIGNFAIVGSEGYYVDTAIDKTVITKVCDFDQQYIWMK